MPPHDASTPPRPPAWDVRIPLPPDCPPAKAAEVVAGLQFLTARLDGDAVDPTIVLTVRAATRDLAVEYATDRIAVLLAGD